MIKGKLSKNFIVLSSLIILDLFLSLSMRVIDFFYLIEKNYILYYLEFSIVPVVIITLIILLLLKKRIPALVGFISYIIFGVSYGIFLLYQTIRTFLNGEEEEKRDKKQSYYDTFHFDYIFFVISFLIVFFRVLICFNWHQFIKAIKEEEEYKRLMNHQKFLEKLSVSSQADKSNLTLPIADY